jgi:hypothetical protein
MPLIIEKKDIPVVQYQPRKIHDEIAMMAITTNGALYVFDDRCRLVTWNEIDELSLGEATEPELAPHPTMKPNIREIKKPDEPHKK